MVLPALPAHDQLEYRIVAVFAARAALGKECAEIPGFGKTRVTTAARMIDAGP